MRKTVLYGVLAFCLVVLNSCLGDPATQLTMANQAGVVVTGYGPGKAIYTKGDVVVSSEDFQNANVENGECILFDYSIDYGVANNMGAGTDTSYTEAIIYENTISEVNRWNFYNTLTDTSIVAKDELLLSSLQARSAYIRGNLFLFTETDLIKIGIGEVSLMGTVPEEAADDPADPVDPCALIAERFALSPRETDVLPLLLEGRTISRIQETLFISAGTVSTHIRHIYQKTGVDNRQELIDLAHETAAQDEAV